MTTRPLVFSPIVSVVVILILLSLVCILAIYRNGGTGGSVPTLSPQILTTYEFDGIFKNGTVRARLADGHVSINTKGVGEVVKTLGPENNALFTQAIKEIFTTCDVEPVSQPPSDTVAVFTRVIGTKRMYLHMGMIDMCPAARANINSVIIPLLDMQAKNQGSEMIKMKYLP